MLGERKEGRPGGDSTVARAPQGRGTPSRTWRRRLHEIIFEADTAAGKAFDVALLIAILLSVVAVSLESIPELRERHGNALIAVEWTFTLLFTLEYALRLACVERPSRYARSFFGVVDLLAILPTYLSLLLPGSQSLVVIRTLRLLRAFRIFKLAHFLKEAASLRRAIWKARGKIVVFVATVVIAVTIMGSAMYVVENLGERDSEKFTSIPTAMYWAIVTMTTVGYGDIVPETPLGKLLSAVLIMLGYSLIIVPTGFVSAELIDARWSPPVSTQSCPRCAMEGHDHDAVYCKRCGARL